MSRRRKTSRSLTKEQAQRLEDRLNINDPNSFWYSNWYERRGRVIELQEQQQLKWLSEVTVIAVSGTDEPRPKPPKRGVRAQVTTPRARTNSR